MNDDKVAAGKARWAGVGKRSRSRQMKAVRANGGGRPRSKKARCFCGKYTLVARRRASLSRWPPGRAK